MNIIKNKIKTKIKGGKVMIQFFGKKLRNKKGFTLIELIVVIAILGILAAVAIPRLAGFRGQAAIRADIATYDIIDKSVAIGVADGRLAAGTVTIVTNDNGVVTFGGNANTNVAAVMSTLVQAAPVFELTGNRNRTTAETWNIAADGAITSPGIDRTTGVIQ